MNQDDLILKAQALKEALSNSVANYEEKIADLRVQLTRLDQEKQTAVESNEQLQERITTLEAQIAEMMEGRNDVKTTPEDEDTA